MSINFYYYYYLPLSERIYSYEMHDCVTKNLLYFDTGPMIFLMYTTYISVCD